MNELAWVDSLKKIVGKPKNVLVGIGDDCALVRLGKERFLLKSDLFVEGVHFNLKKTSYKNIAKRAIARVLSDFAACGGIPRFIGVSAAIPKYVQPDKLNQILYGILEMGKKYKFALIGGDTGRATKLTLDIWGVGTCDKFISRSGAKTGDYIFISGPLGKLAFDEPFIPKIAQAQYLAKKIKVNAMIDITDGFILDLHRILKESNKGALLDKKLIPITGGEKDYYRGEDYELLFTVDRSEPKLNMLKKKFFMVGKIVDKKYGYMIADKGKTQTVKVKGYTHF
jgi:thiamine-monophosphate kinase